MLLRVFFEDFKTTVCVCVLKSQPVHVCAGNPLPLRKVAGQVPVSRPYDGLLEQECLIPPLSRPKDRVSEPCESRLNPDGSRHDESSKAVIVSSLSKRRAGRYIPELTDDVKTLPSQDTLSQESALDNRRTRRKKAKEAMNSSATDSVGTPLNSGVPVKTFSDSSESSASTAGKLPGRWRRSIPKSDTEDHPAGGRRVLVRPGDRRAQLQPDGQGRYRGDRS